MKPGKLIQTSCANGRVARHATSTSSTTAAAALVCPVVAGAAESNAGGFRRTLSTFGTVARLKPETKDSLSKRRVFRIRFKSAPAAPGPQKIAISYGPRLDVDTDNPPPLQ